MPRRAASAGPRAAARYNRTRRRRVLPRRGDTAFRWSLRSDRRCGLGSETPLEETLIAPDKWFPDHRLARLERQRAGEHRSRVDAGMELSLFAARIDVERQVRKQCAIEFAPDERRVKYPRIHARQPRA